MPQMNKGGKFVFGKSNIQESGKIQFPIQAMSEYQITAEGKVYLFTGSKVTGGFCVTRKGLLLPSKLGIFWPLCPSCGTIPPRRVLSFLTRAAPTAGSL